MRVSAAIWLAFAITAIGCSAWPRAAPPLPDTPQVSLDQLLIYSSVQLPSHHRLLEELNAQRTDVSNRLALPVSDEPIHVFLFHTEERFHDFIRQNYPQFPARRAFFVETDTRLTVFAHWGDRVAEDLRHEVSHGYMHSIVPKLPLWLDEGLAEYFEVPRGHRGLNWPHVEELVSLHEQGQWRPDIQRLEAIESPASMTQVDYAEAWAWVHLLLETEPARRDMLHSYLDTLRRTGTVEPLSLWLRTTPIDPQRTLVEYLKTLKARQLPSNGGPVQPLIMPANHGG